MRWLIETNQPDLTSAIHVAAGGNDANMLAYLAVHVADQMHLSMDEVCRLLRDTSGNTLAHCAVTSLIRDPTQNTKCCTLAWLISNDYVDFEAINSNGKSVVDLALEHPFISQLFTDKLEEQQLPQADEDFCYYSYSSQEEEEEEA